MERQRHSVQPRCWPVLVQVSVLMPEVARPRRRQLHVELVSHRGVERWQQVCAPMTAAPPAAVTVVVWPLPMVM